MKHIKSALGCALMAAFMTVAANNVQAGVALDGTVYAPLNISVRGKFDVNGKTNNVSINEKDIVEKALGFSAGTILAVDTFTGDVWSIDTATKTLGTNVTAGGYVTITLNQSNSTTIGNTTTFAGTVTVAVYSSPVFVSNVLSLADSETASSDWIELTGDYRLSETATPYKNGFRTYSGKFSARNLSGDVHAGQISSATATASGNVTAVGSGPES
jgi:hypothetical protein